MAPAADDDWSDSDDEGISEVETSVLLGVPDGIIESPSDLRDAAVSRIGGLPALLSPAILFESSHCKNCAAPMELLVQMWSPFENSPYDRALYIWGCASGACQGKDGSVRAWRGLRYNEKYATKLEQKLARKRAQEQAKGTSTSDLVKKDQQNSKNPFAMSSNTAPRSGLGSDIFGSVAPPPASAAEVPPRDGDDVDGEESGSESDAASSSSLIVALASTTLEDSPWDSAPSYPPQYLSTVAEYLPPPKKIKAPAADDDARAGTDVDLWAAEKYENSLETDQIFDRFNTRVAVEAQQCVRYELGGTPLPFANDALYAKLFPRAEHHAPATIVSKAEFKVQPAASRRVYDSTSLPACPHCGAPRVFECQLMPNLINVLKEERADTGKKMSDEERRKEVEKALKGAVAGVRGMDWGTVLVFSCEKDCCRGPGGVEKDGWREELVLVHWDT
ncbi:hypothetical protein BV25DRAFT_1798451 [Artomyces pyxidatus]|uniref:Uncharacterized protein n=1 Tax=Artomyces pyxidatus TaxID=48021 RepID=A0ACB8T9X9_9AGAM|nr:hypothetical protein BV25DRAFT_1798451 [Artomyces pyxidatus]